MWGNYARVGLRALARNKTYAAINIFGLAVGIAAALLLLLYVRYEHSYDAWLPNSENIYQVQNYWTDPDSGERDDGQMSEYVAGQALRKDFPQIERHVYVRSVSLTGLAGGEALLIPRAGMVDGPFFDVLPLPLVRGDPASALARPGSAVLSESEAQRFFGAQDPIGRTITLVVKGARADHRVTGVMADLPRNSHLRLDLLIRIDPPTFFADDPAFLSRWGMLQGWNYVALRPGSDVAAIRAALPQWELRNIPDEDAGGRTVNPGRSTDWDLVNIRDVHLGAAQSGAMRPGNDRGTILTFTIVAFLILGMACVNFTNLATARAGQQAREVALRKVLGATRRQLVVQFIGEAVLVTSLALLVGIALFELSLPRLSAFLDADLARAMPPWWAVAGLLAGLVLAVGVAGGAYPAFHLSRFQPAEVLKANKSASDAPASARFRGALVMLQFAISIGLIICTAIVYAQTVHARTVDPGYRRDGLLQVDGLERRQIAPVTEAFAREVARVDGVVAVGRTGLGIGSGYFRVSDAVLPGRTEPVSVHSYAIDDGFLPAMGMDLIAGRALDRSRPGDDATLPEGDAAAGQALAARGVNLLVNETAARRFGFADPAAAVGLQFRFALLPGEAGMVPATVVGVVGDARLRSARQPIDPIAYRLSETGLNHLMVRYRGDPAAVRERVGEVWKRFAADAPFEAAFGEEIVAELHGAEDARARAFAAFAGLAVVIACLGLFGLAAFTAERRTKEIGIRKVLGASSFDIVRLLAWQFSKPVIFANIVAWPVAWWVMRDWLNGFDARIALGPGPFLLAGFIAFAIALGTIAGHAIRVSRANPIEALRYE
ncbi:MAG: ABC transporter permease [Allosphingosinicella sp.]|uniref:ABC transporter permease n=1 Tax=Allosphingosinicella sp. TaxID=2823234 RepID=UPI003949E191